MTHEVFNQVPPLEGYNLYLSDPALDAAVAGEGAKESRDRLVECGERFGSAEFYRWGFEANVNPPRLVTHDRVGNRVDQVEFHPSWHALLETAVENGHHSLPWEEAAPEGAHVTRAALTYMSGQVEAGHRLGHRSRRDRGPAWLQCPGGGVPRRILARRHAISGGDALHPRR